MKIVLANAVELTPILVTGELKHIQNMNRDTLTFVFGEDFSMDELDEAFTESACESITIIGDDESEAIHTGYTIRAELVKKQVEVQKETEGSESVFEKRVFVTMAQRTYTETKLASVAQESIDTQMAVAELAEILMGGAE